MSPASASAHSDPKPRAPAVAGQFYPEGPQVLRQTLAHLLDSAERLSAGAAPMPQPKALIVPHAGYVYSGLTAALAYRRLRAHAGRISRVVLLGPGHRVPVAGLALPEARVFLTPLGSVPVDEAARSAALRQPGVAVSAWAHAEEHSLEVQLPFLQFLLGEFSLLPLVVGSASAGNVAEVLRALWGGPETLVVISTDLSHYHGYDEARERDAATCAAILARRPTLDGEQACGCRPLNGLLELAARSRYELELLDYRTSGDTAGSRDRVVGYAAFALYEAQG
ncbi:MAG: AmmeMemoRadiSam system protein B [Gammaproteobacteria bacterium]|nr:AmmeMemoRadiSam system protein B [Gammaproteobacteria bacterium]